MIKSRKIQQYAVELLAECFATCVLILIGEGGIANYKFARQTSHSSLPIALAFGLGVYSALMIAGSITGAHVNPAVSISLMTIRKLKPIQCVFYIIGQIIGAFLGAFLVYIIYWTQFNKFDGGIRQMTGHNGTADIFFTMPDKDIPHWNTFIDQLISTAFLMIFIMALADESNKMISEKIKPFAFVLVIVGIISAFSINAGAGINPARDLGPRLFGVFVYGWNNVFRTHNCFFWIPVIGPIVGAIFGVWIYQSYTWVVKNYGHFSNSEFSDTVKTDCKIIRIKDEEAPELQGKLKALDS